MLLPPRRKPKVIHALSRSDLLAQLGRVHLIPVLSTVRTILASVRRSHVRSHWARFLRPARWAATRAPPSLRPGRRHVVGCHLDHIFEYGALRYNHPGRRLAGRETRDWSGSGSGGTDGSCPTGASPTALASIGAVNGSRSGTTTTARPPTSVLRKEDAGQLRLPTQNVTR